MIVDNNDNDDDDDRPVIHPFRRISSGSFAGFVFIALSVIILSFIIYQHMRLYNNAFNDTTTTTTNDDITDESRCGFDRY